MNIILKNINSKYQFHLEDDWKFIRPSHFFQDCIEVLESNEKYGQRLLNRNYAEELYCYNIVGGFMKFTSGQRNAGTNNKRYYEHEYYSTKEGLNEFMKRNPNCKQCVYWPHYSLRVGMSKVNYLKKVGEMKRVIFLKELSLKIC